VGEVEIVEAVPVELLEHASLHGFPGGSQKRSDQRRPERLRIRKVA
jgi:hypothetical protein